MVIINRKEKIKIKLTTHPCPSSHCNSDLCGSNSLIQTHRDNVHASSKKKKKKMQSKATSTNIFSLCKTIVRRQETKREKKELHWV